jgi:hypothetical protein
MAILRRHLAEKSRARPRCRVNQTHSMGPRTVVGGGQAASLGRFHSGIIIADACPCWGRDLKSLRR